MVDVSPALTLVDLIGRPSPPLLCSFIFKDIYGHRPFHIRQYVVLHHSNAIIK